MQSNTLSSKNHPEKKNRSKKNESLTTYHTVQYIQIMEVRDFLPQNITPKSALYLLCDV